MQGHEDIKGLVRKFAQVLDYKEGHLHCFCNQGVQVEGWLKGELLYFLNCEKENGRLAGFDREVPIAIGGRRKVDLKVQILAGPRSLEAWIELKHWLIGYQGGCKYNAQFYFGDGSSVGIKPDTERLGELREVHKFILILATENPGEKDWETGLNKFNSKFYPLHLVSLTNPADFPDFYYLGLLEVT
jgi:hypothetical protein